MTVRVRYFAGAADAAGVREASFELPAGATAGMLRAALLARHPRLEGLPFALAVDRAYADDAVPLVDGAEVAVIPPVSGGGGDGRRSGGGEGGRSGGGEGRPAACAREPGPAFEPAAWVHLGAEPLSEAALIDRVRHTAGGAICCFAGTAREYTTGRRTLHLEYEAYRPMADERLEALATEADRRWGPLRIAIAHRLGPVALGESSVVVAVGAPHRAAAFDACRFLMEQLKADVPIWKRELEDTGGRWVEGRLPGQASR